MSTPHILRFAKGVLAVVICGLSSTGCADLARTGSGPSFLIMESVAASRGTGTAAATFTTSLDSDVVTNGSVFTDLGQATVRAEMKNQLSTTAPSAINSVTLTRYRVRYRRTDGKNVEGVDVPYGFDGGSTGTVTIGSSTPIVFDLVRLQAKLEAPLRNLRGLGGQIVISVIAEVTLYGRDQAGNEVSVTGSIDVKFADFGD
jgi:hypothetical protein